MCLTGDQCVQQFELHITNRLVAQWTLTSAPLKALNKVSKVRTRTRAGNWGKINRNSNASTKPSHFFLWVSSQVGRQVLLGQVHKMLKNKTNFGSYYATFYGRVINKIATNNP